MTLRNRQKDLVDLRLLDHEFFNILRDHVLIGLLQQKGKNKSCEGQALECTSILWMHLSSHIDSNSIDRFKELIFNEMLNKAFADFLLAIPNQIDLSGDIHLCQSVSYLLRSIKNMLSFDKSAHKCTTIQPVYHAVIQCLSSTNPITLIKSLKNDFDQTLNETQRLFLHSFPHYLQWYSDNIDVQQLIAVIRPILLAHNEWLLSCTPESYLAAKHSFISSIHQLSLFLIRPVSFIILDPFNQEFSSTYFQLVDFWSSCLSVILSATALSKTTSAKLMKNVIHIIYNFTLHSSVLDYMKKIPNLVMHLLEVTKFQENEIRLHAYRCLSKIMVEADIKTIAKPKKIVEVHLEFLKLTAENFKLDERFDSILESLKSKCVYTFMTFYQSIVNCTVSIFSLDFVQHEQVKNELVAQNAIPFLINLAIDEKYHRNKMQLVILEIFLAMTFDRDACVQIQTDERFMKFLHALTTASDFHTSNVQQVVEGLLWRLDKHVAKRSSSTTYKYDIMISYSHRDKIICSKIQQQLVQDGYRVWFDEDCLRGMTMAGIAEAIENSQSVLICMSDRYKESVYCQSEAHYAYERRCHLLPIVVQSNYKPDGWLGIIVSGRIYVDFISEGFDEAYRTLKVEIGHLFTHTINKMPEIDCSVEEHNTE